MPFSLRVFLVLLGLSTTPLAANNPWLACERLLAFAGSAQASLILQSDFSWNSKDGQVYRAYTPVADAIEVNNVLPVHGGGVSFVMGRFDGEIAPFVGPEVVSPDSERLSLFVDTRASGFDDTFEVSEQIHGSYFSPHSPWAHSGTPLLQPYRDLLGDSRLKSQSIPKMLTQSSDSEGVRWLVSAEFRAESRVSRLMVSSTYALGRHRVSAGIFGSFFPGRSKNGQLSILDFKIVPNSDRLLILVSADFPSGSKTLPFEYALQARRVVQAFSMPAAKATLHATTHGLFLGEHLPSGPSSSLVGTYFHFADKLIARSVKIDKPVDTFFFDQARGSVWVAFGNEVSAIPLSDEGESVAPFPVFGLDFITQIQPGSRGSTHILVKGYKKVHVGEEEVFRGGRPPEVESQYLQCRLVVASTSGGSPVVQSLGAQDQGLPLIRTTAIPMDTNEWLILSWRAIDLWGSDPIPDPRLEVGVLKSKGLSYVTAWKATNAAITPLSSAPMEVPFCVKEAGVLSRGRALYLLGDQNILRVRCVYHGAQ